MSFNMNDIADKNIISKFFKSQTEISEDIQDLLNRRISKEYRKFCQDNSPEHRNYLGFFNKLSCFDFNAVQNYIDTTNHKTLFQLDSITDCQDVINSDDDSSDLDEPKTRNQEVTFNLIIDVYRRIHCGNLSRFGNKNTLLIIPTRLLGS